jgi:hypothetical protein
VQLRRHRKILLSGKNTLALQEQNADGYNRDLAKLAEDQRLRTIELDAHNRFKVLKAQLGPNDGYGYGAVVGIGLDGKLNVGFAMPTWLADLMGIDPC